MISLSAHIVKNICRFTVFTDSTVVKNMFGDDDPCDDDDDDDVDENDDDVLQP